MFQDCRYKPTNEIKIETKNKIEKKNVIDIITLILSYSKAEDTRIK